MTCNAIGLMSGSSLDGLDIALVRLTEEGGTWRYEWIATACAVYPGEWIARLQDAKALPVPDFLRLHTAYGHYTGLVVKAFMERHSAGIAVDFIASHGHTVFHDPATATTCQTGDGASIAAETGLPVISDLRSMDVAYGGQGAPIVPLGERLLFPEYDYWLNLGGIANITYQRNGVWTAFDVCACNQVLNALAAEAGLQYDDGGMLAARGKADPALLAALSGNAFYAKSPPKSLDNSFSKQSVLPLLKEAPISVEDKLSAAVALIAQQIAAVVLEPGSSKPGRLLATGGGALNDFLVSKLRELLRQKNVELVVPDIQTVQYKEALIMALLGALRWRGAATVLHSATGAHESSIGGALWLGNRHRQQD